MLSTSSQSAEFAPIMLFGSTRAGTTLLSLMLGHHRQIAFVGELEWPWDFPLEHGAEIRPTDFHAWAHTHRHFLHHGLRINPALGFDDLVRDFLAQMREQTDPGGRKPHYGCQVHRHYARALATWPNARVIHIVRDGRDVCASWMKFGWLGNAYQAGLRWRAAVGEWDALKATLDPARYRELCFEDLLRDPVGELQRICELLGAPYDDAMLRYHEDTSYDPVDPRQAGKWRKDLSSRDIRLFEALAGHELQRYGYAPSGEAPFVLHPWTRPALALEGKLLHHRARARNFGYGLYLADLVTRRVGPRWLKSRVRLELNAVEQSKVK